MKLYKILLTGFLLLFPSGLILSQTPDIDNQNDDSYLLQYLTGELYRDPGLTSIGLYFNDKFLPGCIKLNTGDSITNINLRFNIFNEKLIYLSPNYGQISLDKQLIKEFIIYTPDSIYRFIKSNLNIKDSLSHFYQICYQGKLTILLERKSTYLTDKYLNNKKWTFYKPANKFYVIINNRFYTFYKINAKEILKVFPKIEENITKEFRKIHIKRKNESDFIKALLSIEAFLVSNY